MRAPNSLLLALALLLGAIPACQTPAAQPQKACPQCPSCPPQKACPTCPPAPKPRPRRSTKTLAILAPQAEQAAITRRFLDANRTRYDAALAQARGWLDQLEVDPTELRAKGIKGKKKLVEQLDSYVRLIQIVPESERPTLLQRAKEVVAPTYRDDYHDMLRVNDKVFKQDSTSYMRAAVLMEGLGLDTSRYRKEILKIHDRLNGHMGKRGPHQRLAFHWYYEHFGLTEPFPLTQSMRKGIVASRRDPYTLTRRLDAYGLTHEVFIPYEFGEKLDADFFSAEDKVYLRHALRRLTVHYVMQDNADLVGELVSCLRYLRFTDEPVYREAIDYLLDAQLPEGKWGSYERYRKRYGDFVDQAYYLHTTAVAIDALSVAFHYREDKMPKAAGEGGAKGR